MKRNLFDNMTVMPKSVKINENTVCRDTGADTEVIKNSVYERLGINMAKKHSKKRYNKKVIIGIAAAVAAVSVIGSTVIATGGSVFGDIFKGNTNAEEVYSGEDVKIENLSDNLNVELTGITGDENSVYVSIELTNKDGNSFTHSNDSTVGLYSIAESEAEEVPETIVRTPHMGYVQVPDAFTIDVDQSDWQETALKNYSYSPAGWGESWETLDKNVETDDRTESKCVKTIVSENGKKLKMYIKYIRMNTPEGCTMTVSCKGLSEYITVKSKNKEVYDDYIENRKLDISFDLSVKLNYQTTAKTVNLSADEAKSLYFDSTDDSPEIHFNNAESYDTQLSISPFGINISTDIESNDIQMSIFEYDSKVVMQDGTEYLLVTGSYINENGKAFCNTEYWTEEDVENFPENIDNNSICMIDTDNIKSITFNGTEVYHNS